MKKSTLEAAIGMGPGSDDGELADEESAPEEDSESDETESVETFLDPTLDIEARVAAFRSAVRACMKGDY